MFCKPSDVLETDCQDRRESFRFRGRILLRPVDLGQEYCHIKWGLPYNLIIDLGEYGCSTSSIGWDTLSQNHKYCFLRNRSRDDVPDTSGTLDTIVEETEEKINDDVAIDAALEDQSLITANVPASESELSSSNQVVSIEAGETNNAVCQFVGDNIDSNLVSIHGNTPFHSMGWIKVTSLAAPLSDPQTTAAVPRVKLKVLDKAEIMREGKVNIIPFMNRKENKHDHVFPLAQLSSSLAHNQPLLTPGDTLWAAG